jgi:hypothetical protein
MNQVNVLPLPDGEIEMNGVYPGADIVTVESDSAQGKITVTVDGTLESSFVLEEYYLAVLSPDGTAGYDDCAKGIILPGIYDATDLLHQFSGDIDSNSTGIQIRVYTSTSGSNYDFYWCRHTFDEFSKVTIPENVVKVEVVLELSIDGTGSVSGSAEFTPMLSLVNWGEPSFEAYKPDLQTQINELATVCDSIGMEMRINLFPFKNGLELEASDGTFVMIDEFVGMTEVLVFQGSDDTSGATEVKWSAYFNTPGPAMDKPLSAKLLPGNYAFDFSKYDDNINMRFDVYKSTAETPGTSDWTLAATTRPQGSYNNCTAYFSVGDGEKVKITAVAVRAAGESWSGSVNVTEPYLRRRVNEHMVRKPYVKSLQEQIDELTAKIDSGGGYNEVQGDSYTESVREETTS